MSKKDTEGDWWTTPTEAEENGHPVIVTGRRDVERFRENPRYHFRVEVSWPYGGDGMPTPAQAETLQQITDAISAEFRKDPVAVLTGIYTGDGRRDWVFYTTSLHIFQRKINEILAPFPTLPLEFQADDDPQWEEYADMRSKTELSAPEDVGPEATL